MALLTLQRPPLPILAVLSLTAPDRCGRAQEAGDRKPPAIPKTWDDKAIDSLELPLPHPGFSPVHVRADYYDRIPVRPIYKSYPVYHPDREPKDYFDWLKAREPKHAWDVAKLKTED